MTPSNRRAALADALRPHIALLQQDLDLVNDGGLDEMDRSWKLRDRRFPYSCTDEEGMILYHLVTSNGLRSGFEVATAFGYSSAYLGLAFRQTGGRLTTLDCYIEEWKESFTYAPAELSAAYEEVVARMKEGTYPAGLRFAFGHVKRLGLTETVEFATGVSPRDVAPTMEGRPLDFAFIDGGHDGDQPTLDFEAVLPLLSEKCLVVFHDNNQNPAVERAVAAAERALGVPSRRLPTRYNLTVVPRGLAPESLAALDSLMARTMLPAVSPDDASRLSVVVQGAVAHDGPAPTRAVCESVRAHFPGAEIVLSTWEGADVSGIDHDVLVLSRDPGPLPNKVTTNVNRQIVSSLAGVRASTRPLVMKTRANVLFHSGSVLNYWDKWSAQGEEMRLFKARVLTPNVFARRPSLLSTLPLHPSDWCFLGLKDDIEFLFDLPLLDEQDLYYVQPSGTRMNRYTPEQYIWVSALRKRCPELGWTHGWSVSPDLLRLTEVSFANNLAILDAESQFGITCPKYPDVNRAFRDFTFFQHEEWLELYERICLRRCVTPDAPPAWPTDDFTRWPLDDERIGALRAAGYSWEAQLIECSIVGPTLRRDATTDALGDRQQTDVYVAYAAAQLLKREIVASEKAAKTITGVVPMPDGVGEEIQLGDHTLTAFPAGRHSLFGTRPARISVCVPVFNAGATLRQCLESVLSQRSMDYQVLIVDNGSTDGTYEACLEYARCHPQVLVYQNARNIGRVPNWNRCLDLAQGELIKLLLVNDYLLPDALEKLAWMMERYPSVVLARGGLSLRAPDGGLHFVARLPTPVVLPSAAARETSMVQQNLSDAPSVQMLRRGPVADFNIRFDETFEWAADFEFAQRLLMHGDFAYQPDAGIVMDMGVRRFATGTHGLLQYQEDIETVIRSFRALGASARHAQPVVDRLRREASEQTERTPERREEINTLLMSALRQMKQCLTAQAA